MTVQDAPDAAGHLTIESLAELMTRVGVEEVQPLVHHLLDLCPVCREAYDGLRKVSREMRCWDYSVAVTEAREAPELWRSLERLPYSRQQRAVETERAYQTWGLCRLLQRMSGEQAGQNAKLAGRFASLAVAICRHLNQAYDPDWIEDLEAISFAYLGNARRALGELESADEDFERSRSLRQEGTGYPSVEAEALVLEALLRRDQHQLADAIALLDRVLEICGGADWMLSDPDAADPARGGEALLHKAWCLYHLGQHEAARGVLEDAGKLLDEERQPRLALARRSGLIWCAIVLGRPEDGEEQLAAALELAQRAGDAGDRRRLRRAEARIDLARGERGPAEQALVQAAHGGAGADPGVDGALAWIELAQLYLNEDAAAAAQQLGAEALALLSSPDLDREQGDVLLQFEDACRAARLTPAFVAGLASTLERRRRPSVTWWSGWGTVLGERLVEDPLAEGRQLAGTRGRRQG